MSDDEFDQPTYKFSEVRARTGVDIPTLELLADDHILPTVRGPRGHARVAVDRVPTWQDLVTAMIHRRAEVCDAAMAQLQRVEAEIEAVANDLANAREHPEDELGHDLLSFRGIPTTRHESTTLTSALWRFEMAVHDLRRYHDAIRDTLRVNGRNVD